MAAESRQAIVCVGLALEAKIAARQFRRERGALNLTDFSGEGCAAVSDCRAIVSFGLAGGLSPELRAGDIVIASCVVGRNGSFATDDVWSERLLTAIPTAFYAPILGVESPLGVSAERRELGVRAGALAVDMESHIVGQVASRNLMRFVAVRVVIDTVERDIPQAAVACLSNNGETRMSRLGCLLLERPTDTLDVLRLCANWLLAREALVNCCEVLSASVRQIGL
ncbi:MAG: hypothetical protein KGL35_06310 [Bradyrhizobium sp.]|uniref:phosphorylase family protein n=1 Tax=Bradyrhizobium sp. TaxID=376 RepID=UPI001C29A995|nr:hypothetical protein [Bradyrhizobium sp.]MBU6462569.1 hypothetical protein [Pseudomonadota bacterium]MDE2067190.1 hypothetical protein [Bradyrhizobium sp.]MDE2468351.1 hypothetical protein [Bradyrhizobium sp.]